jgi:2-polyprenyl-6-hydroxyphenyl methylase/3-demethylubiquinone-9 3-methyltransferase
MFSQMPALRILDYGGGSGETARELKKRGFTNVITYDPFAIGFAARPLGLFDLVVCFEVLEHTHQPKGTLDEILSHLQHPGLVLISTLLQPPNIAQLGLAWWYAAPRNGHVSLFTAKSLAILVNTAGFKVKSLNSGLHLLYRELPPWVSQ